MTIRRQLADLEKQVIILRQRVHVLEMGGRNSGLNVPRDINLGQLDRLVREAVAARKLRDQA